MKLLVAVAIGGALGMSVLPHLPMPHGRETPYYWLHREFTFRTELRRTLVGYPRWSTQRWRSFE